MKKHRATPATAEELRLAEDRARAKDWKRWGPYLSERQWGTVREDYSADGSAWDHFPHDHARSRAYRWGEDGLLGFSDRQCRLCFSLALWNGRDPILKERLFGLTGPEGNHGEDVKEVYHYLDGTPTHSYQRALYRYPQAEFPYRRLVEENAARGHEQDEFELADSGALEGERFFDVTLEYAKGEPEDLLVRITAQNRGADAAELWLLPTVWFRNTWSWEEGAPRPLLRAGGPGALEAEHAELGRFRVDFGPDARGDRPSLLFTENETNRERLYGAPSSQPYVKDAFHAYLVEGRREAVNPALLGTKAAGLYHLRIPAGKSASVHVRLREAALAASSPFGPAFEATLQRRRDEAAEFYARKLPLGLTEDERAVARRPTRALWSKQFYHYVVPSWLSGDPAQPRPRSSAARAATATGVTSTTATCISMPDKWEYPWFAAWDLAFHMIRFAKVDPDFAKHQLSL